MSSMVSWEPLMVVSCDWELRMNTRGKAKKVVRRKRIAVTTVWESFMSKYREKAVDEPQAKAAPMLKRAAEICWGLLVKLMEPLGKVTKKAAMIAMPAQRR